MASGESSDDSQWEVNKPVQRRCDALNEEARDCFGCLWRWITCGGPASRMSQLYVNGRLSKCKEDFIRFRNCMVSKLDNEKEITMLPGPHPVWQIRTRKQAEEFWTQHYQHLGAGRQKRQTTSSSTTTSTPSSSSTGQQQQPQPLH
eukprot:jgi/Chrzof1/12503/Cz06g36190.t1